MKEKFQVLATIVRGPNDFIKKKLMSVRLSSVI
jgi:hypothetical protein